MTPAFGCALCFLQPVSSMICRRCSGVAQTNIHSVASCGISIATRRITQQAYDENATLWYADANTGDSYLLRYTPNIMLRKSQLEARAGDASWWFADAEIEENELLLHNVSNIGPFLKNLPMEIRERGLEAVSAVRRQDIQLNRRMIEANEEREFSRSC